MKYHRLLFLTLGLALFACDSNAEDPDSDVRDEETDLTDPLDDNPQLRWDDPAALIQPEDCDEALEALREHAITAMELRLTENERCLTDEDAYCFHLGYWGDGLGAVDGAQPEVDASDDSSPPSDYSETNTQVAGVDEADTIKTDGLRIFGILGNELVSFSSWPAAALAEISRIPVPGYSPRFFLDEDRVILTSHVQLRDFPSDTAEPDAEDGWESATLLQIIDASDDTLAIQSRHLIEGDLSTSRRIDDMVYLVQQNSIGQLPGVNYWPNDVDADDDVDTIREAFAALRAANIDRINEAEISHWLPNRYIVEDSQRTQAAPLISCNAIFLPNVFSGQSLATIVSFDADQERFLSSSIHGSWGNVYASHNAIYLASTNLEWVVAGYGEDSEREIPKVKTQLHKFVLRKDGGARYIASGEVVGSTLNQFSLDEHDGYLRVASTESGWSWLSGQPDESRVTILKQEGDRLEEVGKVTGLGIDERIFSVRFVGDLGYVVTFRQIDPLYVLDLSDPTAPSVEGELEIPGYSSYIHPMDAETLLTIGRDVDLNGRQLGLKLELFDVSDATDPQSILTYVIPGNAWSDAEHDHLAFNYFAARNLLGFPVSDWSNYERYGEYHLFHVERDRIEPLGVISHHGLLASLNCGFSDYELTAIRAVFIEDYVYVTSVAGVTVHDIRDLDAGPIASIPNAESSRCPAN